MSVRLFVMRTLPTVVLGGALVLGSGAITLAHGGTQHPVTINQGSCADLGKVVIPLGDAGDHALVDGVPAAGEPQGSAAAVPVDGSLTNVAMSFADLVGSPHAIVVLASADDGHEAMACGDIGGHLIGPSVFPVGLAQVDDSGTWGVAILQDNGDGTTEVGIYVVKDQRGDGAEDHDHEVASPDATPSSQN